MNTMIEQNVYFLGIGGIGMSALARYFHQKGCKVSGYDKTCSPLTKKLEEEGIIFIMRIILNLLQKILILL